MRPRDNSKFNLAVRTSSQSSGGDTGHMIVNTSFMLFGCANPASQAIVRAQLLHRALLSILATPQSPGDNKPESVGSVQQR